jgi:hypothetical protein
MSWKPRDIHQAILSSAKCYLKLKRPQIQLQIPHLSTTRFIDQYPEISSCIGVPLESCRALSFTYNSIQAHCQRAQALVQKLSILTASADIWNMDETGLAMGLYFNGYAVLCRCQRRVHSVKTPQNREWVSILEAISASENLYDLWWCLTVQTVRNPRQ